MIKNITGQRFGSLTVIKKNGLKNTHIAWLCRCDCGKEKTINGYSLRHQGTKSCGCKNKKMIGKNNHQWKGDKVKRTGLHDRMRKLVPRFELCQFCNKVPSFDLANISQKYKTTINDWLWLCHQCHMRYDHGWIWKDKKWWKKCTPCGKFLKVCKKNFWERHYKDRKKSWFTYCKQCSYEMVKLYR